MLTVFTRRCLKGVVWLSIIVFGTVGLAVLGSLSMHYALSMHALAQAIQNHQVVIALYRYVFMAIVIYSYPYLLRYVNRSAIRPGHPILQRRWVVLVCLIYEVFIVHQMLAKIIGWLIS